MADIADPTSLDQPSPADELQGNGEQRGQKRQRTSMAGDDDDDDDEKGGRERRKIEIKFIQDKSRRHITFSKRKAGIMKKAYELSVLTGTQVLLLVVSETGLVYTFTTPKLQPLVTKAEGKNLIQACLNAPEPASNGDGVDDGVDAQSPDEVPQMQQPRSNMQQPPQTGYMTPQEQSQYYAQLQHQQQQISGQYGGMPQMSQHQRA